MYKSDNITELFRHFDIKTLYEGQRVPIDETGL